jgi:hypothetical protein
MPLPVGVRPHVVDTVAAHLAGKNGPKRFDHSRTVSEL